MGIPEGSQLIGKRVVIFHDYSGSKAIYSNFAGFRRITNNLFMPRFFPFQLLYGFILMMLGRTALPAKQSYTRDIYGDFCFKYEMPIEQPKRWYERFITNKIDVRVHVEVRRLDLHDALHKVEQKMNQSIKIDKTTPRLGQFDVLERQVTSLQRQAIWLNTSRFCLSVHTEGLNVHFKRLREDSVNLDRNSVRLRRSITLNRFIKGE
jgi:hypothetical protein